MGSTVRSRHNDPEPRGIGITSSIYAATPRQANNIQDTRARTKVNTRSFTAQHRKFSTRSRTGKRRKSTRGTCILPRLRPASGRLKLTLLSASPLRGAWEQILDDLAEWGSDLLFARQESFQLVLEGLICLQVVSCLTLDIRLSRARAEAFGRSTCLMPLRRVGPHEEIHPVFAKVDVKRVRLRIVAFGPLFLGPLSELYGRSHVLQISNLWYLSMCFACLPDSS